MVAEVVLAEKVVMTVVNMKIDSPPFPLPAASLQNPPSLHQHFHQVLEIHPPIKKQKSLRKVTMVQIVEQPLHP